MLQELPRKMVSPTATPLSDEALCVNGIPPKRLLPPPITMEEEELPRVPDNDPVKISPPNELLRPDVDESMFATAGLLFPLK